ncbi:MAG: Ig-like domain-containing protein [Actinomycetota bacterium]|nr:Ig-like domain-containing protein [Actinomycetota bacterium]
MLAAGDIAACNGPGDEATAAILDATPGTVATLGDNTQAFGTEAEFAQCYHPTWGRHKSRTRPSIGNHEYGTAGAWPYWAYFGALAGEAGKGWYSYDLGSWHVVALNSNCSFVGGCEPGSSQEAWLRADLAASRADCTLAYWHHARFSSARFAQLAGTEPFWKALYEAGADVILVGHDHIYERHAPQTPSGDRRPAHGIRQFIVGTGGFGHAPVTAVPLPTSEAVSSGTFGVLKLTLRERGYDWVFLPEAGRTFTDAGSGTCHDPPADTTSPVVALEAPGEGAILRGPVTLDADASDNVSVSRVEFVVDRTKVAEVSARPYALTWDSRSVPDGLRTVTARAVDPTGNPTNSVPRTVVIDNALPQTTIVSGPQGPRRLTSATFVVRSEPGAAFECALDRARFAPCETRVSYTGLAPGRHTWRVRARDAAGNLEPIPVTRSWIVDVRAPVTSIDLTLLRPQAATFEFSANEGGVTFACSFDRGPWTACTSPAVYKALPVGRHEFRVRAADAARNTDWTAPTRLWSLTRARGRLTIAGTPADDRIVGSSPAETLLGLGGDDELRGAPGNDRLVGGKGNDVLAGGPGRDVVLARDRWRDRVYGGPGRDRARADRFLDRLRSIERRR